MAVLCEKSKETYSKRRLEETSGIVSLPPKKRKLGHIAVNGGYPRRQQMGLLPKLLSLGVDQPTWILRKTLAKTDLDICESRLLLTSKNVAPTPLLGIFTNTERASVRDKTGLKLRAFDWLGREYKMVFKFLECNGAYRVIGEWSRFLRENGGEMSVGDGIEIWAFRVPKRGGGTEIGMAFSHYKKDEELIDEGGNDEEEEELAKNCLNETKETVENCLSETKETEEVTMAEWTAALALLELKGIFAEE